jgi:hypothetical protein
VITDGNAVLSVFSPRDTDHWEEPLLLSEFGTWGLPQCLIRHQVDGQRFGKSIIVEATQRVAR